MPLNSNIIRNQLEQLLGKIENLDLQLSNRSTMYVKNKITINEDSIRSELTDIYNNLQTFFTDLSTYDYTDETLPIVEVLMNVDKLIEDVGYQQDTIINLVTDDLTNIVKTIRDQISTLISG